MRDTQKTVYVPAFVVFFAVMAVVVVSFMMSRGAAERELSTQITSYQADIEQIFRDRFLIFEEMARAGGAALSSSQEFSQQDWSRFVEDSAILKRYTSVQNIGYMQRVDAQNLSQFSQDIQTRYNETVAVHPLDKKAVYYPVRYESGRNRDDRHTIGLDGSSIITIDASLNRAVEDYSSIIARSLGGETGQFALYIPQYAPGRDLSTAVQRRQSVVGFMYVTFQMDTLVRSVQGDEDTTERAFALIMASNPDKLFMSEHYETISTRGHQSVASSVAVGSTTLRLLYVFDTRLIVPTYVNSRSMAILVFGTVTALLIAASVWLTLLGKSNQLLLEKERTINEAKDSLLSIASHQLRTPATGVKQYLGLLLQGFSGELSTQQQHVLTKAYASNERQLKIINDILYLARLEAGRIVLSKKMFLVGSVVAEAVQELDEQVQQKGHRVFVRTPKHGRQFYGDEHMVHMVIENLLTNAVKYTHNKGMIRITVTQGKELVIVVKDNGLGIPEAQQKEMFRQFVRIDNDLSASMGGTGIGLYVVQQIVGLHRGTITVQSVVGRGTTFTVTLPIIKPPNNKE